MSRQSFAPAVALTLVLAACGVGSDTAAASAASEPPKQVASAEFTAADITPAMIALGDSIFHGKIGASSCQACHGVGGKGGPAAPNLSDTEWLHSDGSPKAILATIKSGVMAPKKFSSVMPPYGGVMLPEDRTRAVASYVYSLSHPQ